MKIAQPRPYLEDENGRNKAHGQIYISLVKAAFGGEYQVFVGHHIAYQRGGDLSTQNEIPSADALMFDHDIMRATFGDRAISCMQRLASVPTEQRDAMLRHMLMQHAPKDRVRGYMGNSW